MRSLQKQLLDIDADVVLSTQQNRAAACAWQRLDCMAGAGECLKPGHMPCKVPSTAPHITKHAHGQPMKQGLGSTWYPHCVWMSMEDRKQVWLGWVWIQPRGNKLRES